MAIFHWSLQAINRGEGRSATAAAAYRSAERILDERTGELHNYTRKQGVELSFLVVNGETNHELNREQVWNSVEQAERRKDAKVAREIVVALPHELNRNEQRDVLEDYAKGLSQRTGWVVDVCMHAPDRRGDNRNVHAHLLCSTREAELHADGTLSLGKKTRDWDVIQTGRVKLKLEREAWCDALNQHLERGGIVQEVDHRSHAERGTGLAPQVHMGVHATAMERRGIETELGNLNRDIQAHNQGIQQSQELGEVAEIVMGEAEKLAGETIEWIERGAKDVFRFAPSDPHHYVMRSEAYQHGREAVFENQREIERWERSIYYSGNQVSQCNASERSYRKKHPFRSFMHDISLKKDEMLLIDAEKREEYQSNKEYGEGMLELAEGRIEALERRLELIEASEYAKVDKQIRIDTLTHDLMKEVYEVSACNALGVDREGYALYQEEQELAKERDRGLGFGW